MSHVCYGIRDVFHTICGARLYNIPLVVHHGIGKGRWKELKVQGGIQIRIERVKR